jgi:SAM-dependent methyltransferase
MTAFDDAERRMRAGTAEAFGRTYARICAYPVSLLLDAAGVGAGVTVLDAGTGTGTVAVAACARGATVTAVDADPDMVKLAREAATAAQVSVATLPDLPVADEQFDAVVANFVLNHVGRPLAALRELRRVTRPGGKVAVTIWAHPQGSGQQLIGRAVQAAGVTRPDDLPFLAPEDDFPRTADGLTNLLAAAGLTEPSSQIIEWEHRVTADDWWSGPAAGVSFFGHLIVRQPPAKIAEIKRHFNDLSREFARPDGMLALPHAALLASGRAGGAP